MKIKLDSLENLAKGITLLEGGLAKGYAHHTAMSKVHGDMSKAHAGHAALHKAKADGMADDHEDKQYHKSSHDFHKAMADHHEEACKLHKAHADALGSMDGKSSGEGDMQKCEHDKSMTEACGDCKREAAPALVKADGLDSVIANALANAAANLGGDKDFQGSLQEMFKKAVLAKAEELMGVTIKPKAGVTGINADPKGKPTLVRRAGQPEEDEQGQEQLEEAVSPALRHLVKSTGTDDE